MKTWELLYFSLLGICNFIIFRECFSLGIGEAIRQNFGNAKIRGAALVGIIVTAAGGLAHSKAGFNPDWASTQSWMPAIGLPVFLALILKAASDPGSRKLYQGKSSWRSLSLGFTNGEINSDASVFQDHPKMLAAKNLIQEAITYASQVQSGLEPIEARINEAIAYHELGLMYRVVNNLQEAKSAYEASLAILDKLQTSSSDNKRYLSARRDTIFRLGELNLVMGDIVQAKDRCEQSRQLDALLGHNDPMGEIATQQLLDKISKQSKS